MNVIAVGTIMEEMEDEFSNLENYGEFRETQTKFTWTIRGFGKYLHKCKCIKSRVFTNLMNDFKTEWYLFLYPNKKDEKGQNCISLGIQCHQNLVANIELSVLNINGIECYTHSINNCEFNENNVWMLNPFLQRSEVLSEKQNLYNLNVHNGALRIVCTISRNEAIQIDNLNKIERKDWLSKIAEFSKFKGLLNDTIFSDVTFCIGKEKIHAHRAILAYSSIIFKAMFTHRMSERKSNQVKIEDFDVSTMRAMLKFIYTAELEQFDSDRYDNYLKLLIAAEKYCIEGLKDKCQEVLTKELTVDNVLDCIANADFHNASDLKDNAMDFAAANAEQIVETPTFEEFLKLNPAMSCEVVRTLITKKRKHN